MNIIFQEEDLKRFLIDLENAQHMKSKSDRLKQLTVYNQGLKTVCH